MDFFNQTGKLAIGSRLRMLTDKITVDAAAIYKMFGVDLKPKWFPVFFVLSRGEAKTITSIAKEIGHSHPSVSNIIKEMVAKGLVKETKDKSDGRRNMVMLSAKGKRMSDSFSEQCIDVTAAIEQITQQTRNDLWEAIEEWENLLLDKSLLERVKEAKKERESKDIKIVPYEPCYQSAFRTLNEEWITAYFRMEEADYKALDHPKEYILDKGGAILVALYKDEPVGVCALCKMDHPLYDCEAVVNKAKELGGKRIFIESNTRLKPAIHIYHKLGFKELPEYHTTYERGDIQMELMIEE